MQETIGCFGFVVGNLVVITHGLRGFGEKSGDFNLLFKYLTNFI